MSTTPSGTPSPGGSSTSSSAQSANNLAGNSNNNPYQVEYPFKVLQEYCEKYLLQQQDQHHLGNQLLSGNHHQPASKRAKLDTMNVKLEASRMAYLLQGQLQRQTVVVPKTEYSVPSYHQINYAHQQQQQQQQQQSWFYHQQQQYLQQHQLFSSGQHIASGDNKQQQQLFSSGHQMTADAESKQQQQHQLFPNGQHQSQQNYAAYSSNDHASNHASIAQSTNLAGNSNSNAVIEVNDASDVNTAESDKEISTKISDPWTEPQESYNHNL